MQTLANESHPQKVPTETGSHDYVVDSVIREPFSLSKGTEGDWFVGLLGAASPPRTRLRMAEFPANRDFSRIRRFRAHVSRIRRPIFEHLREIPCTQNGIDVDTKAGHIYWTVMGNPSVNDGSIERADLDGRNRKTIVSAGGTFTPKQMRLEKQSGKLYWCDREGMRVMRVNLDGSQVEVLVQTGSSDADRRDPRNHCVGISVDPERGKVYWTQKGAPNGQEGRILRANLELPKGKTAANRNDIEVLFEDLPEPIDLDLDVAQGMLYWTDRGDPPRGNPVNRP